MKLGTAVVLDIVSKPIDFGFKRSRVRVMVGVTTQYGGADLLLHRAHILVSYCFKLSVLIN